MQEDFLSSENCYTYDDEDAGCVLMGYSEYSSSDDGVCGCVCVWGCVGVLAAVTLPAHIASELLELHQIHMAIVLTTVSNKHGAIAHFPW